MKVLRSSNSGCRKVFTNHQIYTVNFRSLSTMLNSVTCLYNRIEFSYDHKSTLMNMMPCHHANKSLMSIWCKRAREPAQRLLLRAPRFNSMGSDHGSHDDTWGKHFLTTTSMWYLCVILSVGIIEDKINIQIQSYCSIDILAFLYILRVRLPCVWLHSSWLG